MHYLRLYTTPDGESHFDDSEVTTAVSAGPDIGAALRSDPIAATAVLFVDNPVPGDEAAGEWLAWHATAGRGFMVRLTGELEVQASDGEIRRLGPGSVLLGEDTAGRGHRARRLGSVAIQNVWITLVE
ncbi:MAG: cupin domain-containing protein [Dehalococcoidia bacterium]